MWTPLHQVRATVGTNQWYDRERRRTESIIVGDFVTLNYTNQTMITNDIKLKRVDRQLYHRENIEREEIPQLAKCKGWKSSTDKAGPGLTLFNHQEMCVELLHLKKKKNARIYLSSGGML